MKNSEPPHQRCIVKQPVDNVARLGQETIDDEIVVCKVCGKQLEVEDVDTITADSETVSVAQLRLSEFVEESVDTLKDSGGEDDGQYR